MLEDLTKGRSLETIVEPRKYNIEKEKKNVATRQGSEKPPRPTHQQTLAHTVQHNFASRHTRRSRKDSIA